ncbi:MAG TPA: glycosyltransferase family 39 protein [Polyangia bacterium]
MTLLLTALGALLRFSALSRQSFWYDEAMSVALARNGIGDLLSGRVRERGNPPLYPVLLHLWSSVFGNSDGAVRALSALLGTLTIPVFVALGRKVLPGKVAFVAGTLLAISPFHLQMAQEARAYTLLALLGTLATYALVKATEGASVVATRKTDGAADPVPTGWSALWPWLLLAASTAAMALTHYFGFFLALAHALYLVTAYRRNGRVLLWGTGTYVLSAAIFAFWLPSLFAQLGVQGNLARSAESWHLHLVATPLVFAFGTTLVWKDSAALPRLILGGLGALTFAGVAGLGLYRAFRRRGGFSPDATDVPAPSVPTTRLLILWLLLPVLIPAVISVLASPLYNTRYVILASLPFCYFAAAGLLELPQWLRTAAGGLVAIAMGASTLSYLSRPVKHQWREAAAFVEAVRKPDDLLLFNADYNETAYAHYAGAAATTAPRYRLLPGPGAAGDAAQPQLFGAAGVGAETETLAGKLKERGRVWLIAADPDRDVAAETERFFAAGWTPRQDTSVRGIRVQLFERAP